MLIFPASDKEMVWRKKSRSDNRRGLLKHCSPPIEAWYAEGYLTPEREEVR